MQLATPTDQDNLVDLVHSLRPDWDKWMVRSVIQSHAHAHALADLVVAATRYAADPTNRDPRGIGWRGKHWRDLDTEPTRNGVNQRVRCYTCGKTEDRCLTERPGPDDHEFEATLPADMAVIR